MFFSIHLRTINDFSLYKSKISRKKRVNKRDSNKTLPYYPTLLGLGVGILTNPGPAQPSHFILFFFFFHMFLYFGHFERKTPFPEKKREERVIKMDQVRERENMQNVERQDAIKGKHKFFFIFLFSFLGRSIG
jgi:hypothetical protein